MSRNFLTAEESENITRFCARAGLREMGAAISFLPMRLLRALAHLVLALALIGVAVAPARAVVVAPAGAHQLQADRHHHHRSAVHAEHAGHDHGAPASEHPAHKQDGCQTLCCFIPSQVPPYAPVASAAAFFCAVRYVEAAQPASGRADAPDPGIPKAVV